MMLFSSLNTMLPEAQDYLQRGGLSDRLAAWVNIVCFLGGVIGIQAFSRILHHFIPSNVVDCDHTHEGEDHDHDHHDHGQDKPHHRSTSTRENESQDERTPLMTRTQSAFEQSNQVPPTIRETAMEQLSNVPPIVEHARRPNLQPRLTSRVATFIAGSKSSCDEGGPCYGYSDPCGMECFKIGDRIPTKLFGRSFSAVPRQPSLLRSITTSQLRPKADVLHATHKSLGPIDYHSHRPPTGDSNSSAKAIFRGRHGSNGTMLAPFSEDAPHQQAPPDLERADSDDSISGSSTANDATHHHHVPENAFYSIGLQTSLAIALHKLPEGFITYATNHANPELGFSVFMALFIHNFTEGFAMALPMYLALKNRLRAMAISSVLGGISQPFGAAIAALWFQLAGSGDKGPGETVYGCMFSVTAGIMASVALQLFSESLTLTHNRHLCTVFAFVGMAILQISHALTT